MKIREMKVNHLTNPMGFELHKPVFSWKVDDAAGKKQQAAKIRIFSDPSCKRELAIKEGNLNSLCEEVDLSLQPYTRYFWTVSVKDETGDLAVSEVSYFETAKMDDSWQAKWIGCKDSGRLPVFSKKITQANDCLRARLYITGLGLYEASFNGHKIGDEYLTPYSNNYDLWVQYQTFDITKDVREGGELSVFLGNGWYKGRFGYDNHDGRGRYGQGFKLLAEIRIWHEDGRVTVIGTDDTWTRRDSNITMSNLYDGEVLDETLPVSVESPAEIVDGPSYREWLADEKKHTEETGQLLLAADHFEGLPGDAAAKRGKDSRNPSGTEEAANSTFTDPTAGSNTSARKENDTSFGNEAGPSVVARYSLPVFAHELLQTDHVIVTPAGEQVLDLGQEIAGIFCMRVHEKKGTKIHLQFGEILQGGNFYNENLRTAKAEYIYISDGQEHVLEPKFTYYGYRYVKIEGVTNLDPKDFTAVALYSDLAVTGQMDTGVPVINQLVSNVLWGQKGNFLDVPTDCPQRDERMGWTGDANVFSPTALMQMDCYAFYRKYLHDVDSEQREHGGMVSCVVPAARIGGTGAVWGDAAVIIPWNVYQTYGDKRILEEQFESMKGWVDYIRLVDGDDHGWSKVFQFGDWLALDGPQISDAVKGGTDEGFIAQVSYARSADLVAKSAAIIGKTAEAQEYRELADRIRAFISDEYYSKNGRPCIDTMTGMLLTLRDRLGSVPSRAAERLDVLLDENGGKLKTGFVGTPILCEQLSEAGLSGRAYDLLFQEEYPGWLYEIRLGATTVWERWNSVLEDGSISSTGMNSLNHYSYGSIVNWLYRYAAGIRPMPAGIVPESGETGDNASPSQTSSVFDTAAGFRKVLLAPEAEWRLGRMAASYDSPAGIWKSEWEITDETHIKMHFTVPFNCTGYLRLANVSGSEIRRIADILGMSILGTEAAKADPAADSSSFRKQTELLIVLEPGDYAFTCETEQPLHKEVSIDTPVGELMRNTRARVRIERDGYALREVPDYLSGLSVRELNTRYGDGRMTPELMHALDEDLRKM